MTDGHTIKKNKKRAKVDNDLELVISINWQTANEQDISFRAVTGD